MLTVLFPTSLLFNWAATHYPAHNSRLFLSSSTPEACHYCCYRTRGLTDWYVVYLQLQWLVFSLPKGNTLCDPGRDGWCCCVLWKGCWGIVFVRDPYHPPPPSGDGVWWVRRVGACFLSSWLTIKVTACLTQSPPSSPPPPSPPRPPPRGPSPPLAHPRSPSGP